MENATKALLISAGVLMVILLIGFGMSIFKSSGDTAGQAQNMGAQISSTTDKATANALSVMQGL